MGSKSLLTIILVVVFFKATAQDVAREKSIYTKSEIVADINFLIEKYEEIHPNPYLHKDSNTIQQLKNQIVDDIPEEVSITLARQLTGSVASKFVFGHSDILPIVLPKDKSNRANFPFWVLFKEHKIVIQKNLSDELTIDPFSEILSINGISSSEVVTVMINSVSGETKEFKERFLCGSFSNYLNFFFGFEGPEFVVEIKHNNGTIRTYTLQKATNIQGNSIEKASLFNLSFLDDQVALIDINAFANKKDFKTFLEDAFQKVAIKNTETLIIDVRGNGGGNSNLISQLTSYLTNKPITIFNGGVEKTSKASKKYNHKQYIKWYMYPVYPLLYFIPDARPKFTNKNGSITKTGADNVKPKKFKNKFAGKVFVLVDEGTFSTASVFASTLQCADIAKIVGRSTGEPVIGDGNTVAVILPNTKIIHEIGTSLFYNACHENADESKMMKTDIYTGNTDELQFLLNWLKK